MQLPGSDYFVTEYSYQFRHWHISNVVFRKYLTSVIRALPSAFMEKLASQYIHKFEGF